MSKETRVAMNPTGSELMQLHINEATSEDMILLDALAGGFDIQIRIDSHYERILTCIDASGILITGFAKLAFEDKSLESTEILLKYLLPDGLGGYSIEDAKIIALNGIQFNAPYLGLLPPQWESVLFGRGLFQYERYSRDLEMIRPWLWKYTSQMRKLIREAPRLERMTQY